ncbi:terpene cyclase [Streptomyces sp. NPDC059597]|uniref:terpene synthase family protein n=1 Tax=Streptomyces sp. NPDC059597 TaxID=3346879 RepID=UPI00369FFE4C
MTTVRQLEIPCPGRDPNPAGRTAAGELRSWADRFGLLQDANRGEILRRANPAHVAARLYPDAPPRPLTLATQWLAVNFLVDDLLDAEDDCGRCEALVDHVVAAFDGAPTTGDPLMPAITDLWRRTTVGRSAQWCRTFRDDCALWLWTYAREAIDRVGGRVPGIDEYRRHRRLSSGMFMFADLVEPASGVDLPSRVRRLDAVHTLRARTSEYMGLVNDLYSIDKELATGQVHNAVRVVMHRTGVDIVQAVDAVGEMASASLRAFEEAAGSAGTSEDVRRCVQGYRLLMRGAVDCCAELDRYVTPAVGPQEGTPA